MTTDPTELYPVISQIAAVFAGFGSLGSGIGQRRGGDDARVDAFRLGMMLFASLSATLLGLLPATLSRFWPGGQAPIRNAAAIAVIAMVIYLPAPFRGARKLRHVVGFNVFGMTANSMCALVALIGFAGCALDSLPGHAADLYLVGLVGLLGSSIVMFSRVILSMLRPHSRGGEGEL